MHYPMQIVLSNLTTGCKTIDKIRKVFATVFNTLTNRIFNFNK